MTQNEHHQEQVTLPYKICSVDDHALTLARSSLVCYALIWKTALGVTIQSIIKNWTKIESEEPVHYSKWTEIKEN